MYFRISQWTIITYTNIFNLKLFATRSNSQQKMSKLLPAPIRVPQNAQTTPGKSPHNPNKSLGRVQNCDPPILQSPDYYNRAATYNPRHSRANWIFPHASAARARNSTAAQLCE